MKKTHQLVKAKCLPKALIWRVSGRAQVYSLLFLKNCVSMMFTMLDGLSFCACGSFILLSS